MATKNNFAVKADILPEGRARDFDGPWKASSDEAIRAFAKSIQTFAAKAAKMDPNSSIVVFRPFLAQRVDASIAPAQDNRGNYYRTSELLSKQELNDALVAAGVNVAP